MILGATQSGFKFLQQHLTFPSNIEVDFNRREIREIVSWLLVAKKIYSFDNINEAIKDGKQVY